MHICRAERLAKSKFSITKQFTASDVQLRKLTVILKGLLIMGFSQRFEGIFRHD
jgi:hypothetical protein